MVVYWKVDADWDTSKESLRTAGIIIANIDNLIIAQRL